LTVVPYDAGWRRGSVVRTSVFDWRTFPDLRLICGSHVTSFWVRCPLWVNQPGQLSFYPIGVSKWVYSNSCNYMVYGGGDNLSPDQSCVCGCLAGRLQAVCAGLAYSL